MSRTGLALLVIFVVALGIRLAYLSSDPHPRFGPWLEGGMAHNIVVDGHWFQVNERATAFAESAAGASSPLVEPASVDLRQADEHPLWTPEIVEPVGESLVLAGLWEVTGSETFLADQLLRIMLDALCALLVYRIVMQLFARPRAALLAAALYAVNPPIAWQTISPYMDIWAVDLTIAILALQLQASRSPHPWRWLIACGLLVGFGTYFRPFLLVLSVALAIVLNLDVGRRAALTRGAACTAVALTLVIPWTIRNYNDFHRFIPFRSGLGQTLWEGLGELPNGFGATYGGAATEQLVYRARPDLTVESPAWDAFLQHKAIAAIERHPLFYGELLAYRSALATVWSYSTSWMGRGATSPLAYKEGPLAFVTQRPLNLLEVILEPAVFLLAMLSLILTRRRWRRGHIVLLTVVLATVLPYVPLLIDHRYILPAAFAYLIWIALGADLLAERLRHIGPGDVSRGRRRPSSRLDAAIHG